MPENTEHNSKKKTTFFTGITQSEKKQPIVKYRESLQAALYVRPVYPLKFTTWKYTEAMHMPPMSVNQDFSQIIYQGLAKVVTQPDDISHERFHTILKIHAEQMNYLYDQTAIDEVFDIIEGQLSRYIDSNSIFKHKLLPESIIDNKSNYGFYPLVNQGMINYVETNTTRMPFLEKILIEQLQQQQINLPSLKLMQKFNAASGHYVFLGLLPPHVAVNYIKKGIAWTDFSVNEADTIFHGTISHWLQIYAANYFLTTKLINTSVKGESDVTARELHQAKAWQIPAGNNNDNPYLWDILHENRGDRAWCFGEEFNTYTQFGLSVPDNITAYIMTKMFRWPALASVIYEDFTAMLVDYASHLGRYYYNDQGEKKLFSELTPNDKQTFLNAALVRERFAICMYDIFLQSEINTNNEYATVQEFNPSLGSGSVVLLKKRVAPLHTQTLDDSHHYIAALEKIKLTEKMATFPNKISYTKAMCLFSSTAKNKASINQDKEFTVKVLQKLPS